MGFLFTDYNRPGPGVNPDEPRKTGFARLWEIFRRDCWSLMPAGLLTLAGVLPFMAGVFIAYSTHSLFVMLLAGLAGGMAASPGMCGMADVLLQCLRNEPWFWWHRYRLAVKRNWKEALLPGAIFGTVFSVQWFTLLHFPQSQSGPGMLLCQLVSMAVSAALFLYVLMQVALMNLPPSRILKNSVWLSVRYLPRTLKAALFQVIYWLLAVLFFPATALVMLLTSVWLPLLVSFVILYPVVDETFQIEERLRDVQENFYGDHG